MEIVVHTARILCFNKHFKINCSFNRNSQLSSSSKFIGDKEGIAFAFS